MLGVACKKYRGGMHIMAIQITPPVKKQQEVTKVIFPFTENRQIVDAAATKYLIEVFPDQNIILFSGSSSKVFELKKILTGGVIA